MAGWLAQWEEMLLDKEQKIARPRQLYVGPDERPYRSNIDHAYKVTPRLQKKDALRQ
jgi:citrate synthase